jgi:hypothetical protein
VVDATALARFNQHMAFALRPLAPLLALLALAGCGARRIPDTQIQDTKDTRAVLEVIEKYRQAAERRDAPAVLALVSTSYFDDAGTTDPADDIDYGQLVKVLPADYAKLSAMRLDIAVKKIDVNKGKGRATAEIFYDSHFRVTTPSGEVPKSESDVHRMTLRREGDSWRFVAGL